MSPHLFSGSIGLSNDTATTEIYTYWHTLPLHDALPIWRSDIGGLPGGSNSGECYRKRPIQAPAIKFWRKLPIARTGVPCISGVPPDRRHTLNVCRSSRSEEHTSELQSLIRISYADFCLIIKI